MADELGMVPCVKTGAQVILSRVPIPQKVAERARNMGWISSSAYKKLIYNKKDAETEDRNISHGVSKGYDDFAGRTKQTCENFKENKTPLSCNSVNRKRKRNKSCDDNHPSPSSSSLQTNRGRQLKKLMINEPVATTEKCSAEVNQNSSKRANYNKVSVFDEENDDPYKSSSPSSCSVNVKKNFQMPTSDIAQRSELILRQNDKVSPSVHTEAVKTKPTLDNVAKNGKCSCDEAKKKLQSECESVQIPDHSKKNLCNNMERINSDGSNLFGTTPEDQKVVRERMQSGSENDEISAKSQGNVCKDIKAVAISTGKDLLGGTSRNREVISDKIHSDCENVKAPDMSSKNCHNNSERVDNSISKDLLGVTSQSQELISEKIQSGCEYLIKTTDNSQENSCADIERINSGNELLEGTKQDLVEVRNKIPSDSENLQVKSQGQEILQEKTLERINTDKGLSEAAMQNLKLVRDEMQSNCESTQTSDQRQGNPCCNIEGISIGEDSSGEKSHVQKLEQQFSKESTQLSNDAEHVCISDTGNDAIKTDNEKHCTSNDDEELVSETDEMNRIEATEETKAFTQSLSDDLCNTLEETFVGDGCSLEKIVDKTDSVVGSDAQTSLMEYTEDQRTFREIVRNAILKSVTEIPEIREERNKLELCKMKLSNLEKENGRLQDIIGNLKDVMDDLQKRVAQTNTRGTQVNMAVALKNTLQPKVEVVGNTASVSKVSSCASTSNRPSDIYGESVLDASKIIGGKCSQTKEPENNSMKNEGRVNQNVPEESAGRSGVIVKKEPQDEVESENKSCDQNSCSTAQTFPTADQVHHSLSSSSNASRTDDVSSLTVSNFITQPCYTLSAMQQFPQPPTQPRVQQFPRPPIQPRVQQFPRPPIQPGTQQNPQQLVHGVEVQNRLQTQSNAAVLLPRQQQAQSAVQLQQQYPQQYQLRQERPQQLYSQHIVSENLLNPNHLLRPGSSYISGTVLSNAGIRQQCRPSLVAASHTVGNAMYYNQTNTSIPQTSSVNMETRSSTGPPNYIPLVASGTVANSGQIRGLNTYNSLQQQRVQQMRELTYQLHLREQMRVQSLQSQNAVRKTSSSLTSSPLSSSCGVSNTVNTVAMDTTSNSATNVTGFKANDTDVSSPAVAKSNSSVQQQMKLQRERVLAYQRYKKEQIRVQQRSQQETTQPLQPVVPPSSTNCATASSLETQGTGEQMRVQQRLQQETTQPLQPVVPPSSTNCATASSLETQGTREQHDSSQVPSSRILMLTPPSTPSSVSPSDSVGNPVSSSDLPSLVNMDKTPTNPQMSFAKGKEIVVTSQMETQGNQNFSHSEDLRLPPKLNISVALLQGKVVLSWNTSKVALTPIAKYAIYSYIDEDVHEMNDQHWRCIGYLSPSPMPMACSLTEFEEGLSYYFAVRAVDIFGRLGPLSLPKKVTVAIDGKKKES